MTALPPGSTIGILGGGQLGRMLAMAAAPLGFDVKIFVPQDNSPAERTAVGATIAGYDDRDAVEAFARGCDVVTYEFENVPADTARAVERAGVPLRPGAKALEVAQDRLKEKTFVNESGAATVAFAAVSSPDDFAGAADSVGFPAILKTRHGGYDGKGQAKVGSAAELEGAFDSLGRRPCILEAMCGFVREVSVIAARSLDGDFVPYPLAENEHRDGILWRSTSPVEAKPVVNDEANRIARAILEALDYVGVIGVELFECEDGTLLVNEFAPRVHNSGHWSIEGSQTSQFEQHIRAVAGWPLGDPAPLGRAQMVNLIGEDAETWPDLARESGAHIHLYGKNDIRPGRKMGHVTRVSPLKS